MVPGSHPISSETEVLMRVEHIRGIRVEKILCLSFQCLISKEQVESSNEKTDKNLYIYNYFYGKIASRPPSFNRVT